MRLVSLVALVLGLSIACDRGPPPAPEGAHDHDPPPPSERRAPAVAEPRTPAPPAPPTRTGAGDAPSAPAAGASAGGLRWSAAPPLVARAPSSQMRAAEYAVAGEAGEAVLSVFFFGPGMGGTVQDNLDRWVHQVTQPDGADSMTRARIEHVEVHGLRVTTLDVGGNMVGGMMGQPGEGELLRDQLVLGAIAEGPAAPVFFKLSGPRATVESARGAFEALVGSLAPE